MSLDMATERVCYVNCNFCNTILAVSVPCCTMLPIVTVRCGHCANLLSVNMGALLPTFPAAAALQDLHLQQKQQCCSSSSSVEEDHAISKDGTGAYSAGGNMFVAIQTSEQEPPRTPPIRPPEKRQRVPSAYNRFIKEEIQRIKAGNPEISHREAFSTAAKNWAHFPHIHFGLKLDGSKQES